MSYFGTDGIRGKFGQFPITPEFLLRLGYVAGQIVQSKNASSSVPTRPSVLIGKDTRLSCDAIEASLQAGFHCAGVDVYRLGVIPTPAIAHLTKSFQADLGVVISASHNPYEDNGVKFFNGDGKKIDDDTQNIINQQLDNLYQSTTAQASLLTEFDPKKLGKTYDVMDASGRYIEFCKGVFAYQHSLRGLTIALDCANGAGYKVAPHVFRELGANVFVLGDTPNGCNINEHCGSTHPEPLQQFVLEHNADVGIALDGDGDRIVMVDKRGKVIDGDGILYALVMGDVANKPVGVVGTQMSNMALELALTQRGIDFERSKVGDRYVMQALCDKGWVLGGEPSGHILTLDKAGTGDAIVAGLQVLGVMVKTGKSLDELLMGYHPMPQTLINVRLKNRQDPNANAELVEYFKQIATALADTGRLLVRPSGTEPLIRVMVECQDADQANKLAGEIADNIIAVLDTPS